MAPAQAGSRLDQFLAQSLGWSRARLQKLLKSGRVLVNGARGPPPTGCGRATRDGERARRPRPATSPPKPCPWTSSLKTLTSWW